MIDLIFTHSRYAYMPFGTYGRVRCMYGDTTLGQWWTVEQSWNDNKPFHSCIPEADYECIREHYYRGNEDTIEFVDVPGRSEILVHVANWPMDVQGCIGIGTEIMGDSSRWGVANSGKAMRQLFDILYRKRPDAAIYWRIARRGGMMEP